MEMAYTFDDVQLIPYFSKVMTRSNVSITTDLCGLLISHPLIPANMDSIMSRKMIDSVIQSNGICFVDRFMGISDRLDTIKYYCDNTSTHVGVSVGVNEDEVIRQICSVYEDSLMRNKLDRYTGPRLILLIDVAHGHHVKVKHTIEFIRSLGRDYKIIAGNVATYQGAYDLCVWGADGIKVGIGNGSICSTRMMTGFGVPQFTAILECRKAISDYIINKKGKSVSLVSDGGIKNPCDISKAIAAGADACMSGYLFAGCNEVPNPQNYRGSASFESKASRGESGHVEGVSVKIAPKNISANDVFFTIGEALKSAFSYVGSTDINDFRRHVSWTRVTNAGMFEARPNMLEVNNGKE
jgi:IMP dehydrogenase